METFAIPSQPGIVIRYEAESRINSKHRQNRSLSGPLPPRSLGTRQNPLKRDSHPSSPHGSGMDWDLGSSVAPLQSWQRESNHWFDLSLTFRQGRSYRGTSTVTSLKLNNLKACCIWGLQNNWRYFSCRRGIGGKRSIGTWRRKGRNPKPIIMMPNVRDLSRTRHQTRNLQVG